MSKLREVNNSSSPNEIQEQEAGSIEEAYTTVPELPSEFIPYPKGTRVQYRPYTYAEVEAINGRDKTLLDKVEIAAKGIKTDKIRPSELTAPDFLALAFTRRIVSLGPSDFGVQYRCKHCLAPGEFTFSIGQIQFDYMKARALPARLRRLGSLEDVRFMPLTLGSYMDSIREGSDTDSPALMARQCVSHDFKTAYEAVSNAYGEDLRHLKIIDDHMWHGLRPAQTICSVCEKETTVDLDGLEAHIFPSFRNEFSEEDGISFGD